MKRVEVSAPTYLAGVRLLCDHECATLLLTTGDSFLSNSCSKSRSTTVELQSNQYGRNQRESVGLWRCGARLKKLASEKGNFVSDTEGETSSPG